MSREEKLWNLFCVAIGNYRSAESTLIFESNANIQYQLNKLDEEVKKMADEFEEALRQPPADQWITCKTELPKESGEYWTTIIWGGKPMTTIGTYDAKRKAWNRHSYDPIAWKPYEFPEPYKGVE